MALSSACIRTVEGTTTTIRATMSELPRHLTPELVEQYARESETVLEFQRKARLGREKARPLLRERGLIEDLQCGAQTRHRP
jgi:hypothetical protein